MRTPPFVAVKIAVETFNEIRAGRDAEMLRWHLHALENRSNKNKLNFKVSECKTINFVQKHEFITKTDAMKNEILERVDAIKNLVVLVD